ncbi:hypothetical protein QTP70_006852, partial [Hemibagrus guttatus]
MTAKVRALLKSWDSSHQGGKACTLPEYPRHMWQSIQSITNYRPASPACDRDASLPDALNSFYARVNQDFLTGRPQSVRIGNSTSSTTTLSTGAPQGCVLSPLLFTLLTHDCAGMHSCNHILKFTDDTTMVGLIRKNNESAYRQELRRLTAWCKDNNPSQNMEKMKEMVVVFRRAQ